jgi:methyltransferase
VLTRTLFTLLVAAVAVQRLAELRRSRRHEAALRAAGAHEHARWQVPMLAAVHTAWLVAACVEVWWLEPPFRPTLAAIAFAGLAAGQGLRYAAMSALGPRWTISVLTLPAAPPVATDVYRYLRHPNYVGVVFEIAALPLVHGAVWTAAIASVVNAAALACRIRAEERALESDNAYGAHFRGTRRFVPGPPRRSVLP